jgi:Ca-activated chloride channel family protein
LSFLNPWGLLALLLIPPVILLYMLKKQHEDLTVSSTLLWQQVLKDLQATRPWQRLRARLLLILQILAVLLFAFSLARPIFFGGEGGIHYIAVVDISARMQATDVKPSRMDRAREGLLDLIQTMKPKDTMTIIQAGIQPFIAAGPTGENSTLREYAGKLRASNGRTDLTRALQLAQTILRDSENETGQIHVFSDKQIDTENGLISHVYSENGQNAAVTHVSYDRKDDRIIALSRVANYGEDRSITLELKIDGALNNIKEVYVPAGEVANVYWMDIPASAQIIEVSLAEEDDLILDNYGAAAVNEEYLISALMVTERNVFLERAVSLRSDIELFKANPGEDLESDDFQLYLFDGSLPDTLPVNGHMILFNPPFNEELGLTIEGEIVPSGIAVNQHALYQTLVEYIEPEGYQIAKAGKMTVPPGFDVLLSDQSGNPILAAGESKGRKIVIFPFSLHRSNLPLKADFPILIQNILSWMLPPSMNFSAEVYAGEALQLSTFQDAAEIIVQAPSGKEYRFDAYPAPLFYDTQDVGVYKVIQKAEDQAYEGSFVVSVPTMEVSDLRLETSSGAEQPGQGGTAPLRAGSPFQKEIWLIAGWGLLLLLLIEWWVYHHGI